MRTLILSCSATKLPDADELPAIARYDGPAYRTLRANLPAAGPLRVFILSAEHGLIAGDTPIADYDRRMTRTRAAELAPSVADDLLNLYRRRELVDSFVIAGALYRHCIRCGLTGRPALSQLRFAAGGIGEQLGQLKAFLLEARQLEGEAPRDPAVAAIMRETGMAELQAIRHLRDRRELQRRASLHRAGGRRS